MWNKQTAMAVWSKYKCWIQINNKNVWNRKKSLWSCHFSWHTFFTQCFLYIFDIRVGSITITLLIFIRSRNTITQLQLRAIIKLVSKLWNIWIFANFSDLTYICHLLRPDLYLAALHTLWTPQGSLVAEK